MYNSRAPIHSLLMYSKRALWFPFEEDVIHSVHRQIRRRVSSLITAVFLAFVLRQIVTFSTSTSDCTSISRVGDSSRVDESTNKKAAFAEKNTSCCTSTTTTTTSTNDDKNNKHQNSTSNSSKIMRNTKKEKKIVPAASSIMIVVLVSLSSLVVQQGRQL